MGNLIVVIVGALFAMWVISRIARVVPQQQGWVVERLGKFSGTLNAGFHILIPFLDTVRYKHSLKEASTRRATPDTSASRRSTCAAACADARAASSDTFCRLM